MDKTCLVCQKKFHATRSTAKFCSTACKLKYNRQSKESPESKAAPKPPAKNALKTADGKCPKCGFWNYDPTRDAEGDEWSHSACFKSQEEVETHYTEANFPSKGIRYVIGGAVRVSPWRKDDPHSKAYY